MRVLPFGIEVRLDARPDPQRSRDGRRKAFVDYVALNVSPGAEAGEVVCPERQHLPNGTKLACRRLAKGLACELAIPSAYLDKMQAAPWKAFRLNVAVSDRDAPDDGFLKLHWLPKWGSKESCAGSGTFRRVGPPAPAGRRRGATPP